VGLLVVVGQCINVAGSYFCLCLSSWTGPDCSRPLFSCDDRPCLHNGACRNGSTNRLDYCNCTGTGYTGTVCELDVDECQEPGRHRCSNNSTCANVVGGYVCNCLPSYTGKTLYSWTRGRNQRERSKVALPFLEYKPYAPILFKTSKFQGTRT